jgi:hypothetical protein
MGTARSACQGLPVDGGNVSARVLVAIFLRKAVVNEKHLVGRITGPHHKVVGFDVAVDEVLVVHVLDRCQHLISQHENGLERESPAVFHQEIFERLPKKFNDKNIMKIFGAVPEATRNTDAALHELIPFRLKASLGGPVL